MPVYVHCARCRRAFDAAAAAACPGCGHPLAAAPAAGLDRPLLDELRRLAARLAAASPDERAELRAALRRRGATLASGADPAGCAPPGEARSLPWGRPGNDPRALPHAEAFGAAHAALLLAAAWALEPAPPALPAPEAADLAPLGPTPRRRLARALTGGAARVAAPLASAARALRPALAEAHAHLRGAAPRRVRALLAGVPRPRALDRLARVAAR